MVAVDEFDTLVGRVVRGELPGQHADLLAVPARLPLRQPRNNFV